MGDHEGYTHQYYENWTTLNSYDCTVLIKHPINWDFFVPRINSYILVFIKKKACTNIYNEAVPKFYEILVATNYLFIAWI